MFDQMCQLSIYCLSAPNSPFTAYSAKMDVGFSNIYPAPVGMLLSCVSRRYWRDTVGGRGFRLTQYVPPGRPLHCSRPHQCLAPAACAASPLSGPGSAH